MRHNITCALTPLKAMTRRANAQLGGKGGPSTRDRGALCHGSDECDKWLSLLNGAVGIRPALNPMEEAHMKQQSLEYAIPALTEAASRQEEVAAIQLALVWEGRVITQSFLLFQQLEADEALAYVDKVAVQLHALQESRESLWCLHKTLRATCRRLKAHQRDLRQLKGP